LDKTLREQYENPAKGLEKAGGVTARLMPFASKVQPYLTGEPFFREDVWSVIDQADEIRKNRLIEVEVSTNALLLKGKLLERVLRSSITSLLVTVNAGTEKTYARLCGGSFSVLKRNLIALRESPLMRKSLQVSLSYVLMRENMEELPAFVRLAKTVGANAIQIWSMNNVAVGMDDRITRDGFEFRYKQQMSKYYPRLTRRMLEESQALAAEIGVRVGVTPSYRLDGDGPEDIPYPLAKDDFERLAAVFDRHEEGLSVRSPSAIRKCYFPWNSIYYTTEGNFAPCLHLVYKGGFANILEGGIDGVWNGRHMRALRQSIIDGEVHPFCRDAQCPFIR
jgi:MoaA/NifB/PqqE/SkfB family radical SAM enzyme